MEYHGRKKGLFINIEGLSCTGKTTIANLLVSKINATLEPTVPRVYSDLRKIIDQSESIDARFCFYLSAVFYSADNIEKVLKSRKNVVVESYFYRTIAFHRGMGSNIDFMIPENAIRPAANIFLECEANEREKRKVVRVKETNYWTKLSEKKQKDIYREYNKFRNQMFVIDTTTIPPNQVVKKIIKYLNAI